MKKTFLLTVILWVMVLTGCGHKSNEEITDIEQFRCSDSIQTVFNVLGESELQNSMFGGEYYEYEDLNLWGYNGSAIFRVRNDEETISSFYCNLTLSKKEFINVFLQLGNKYGEYEIHEYSNQIAYVWEIEEDEAREIGYNKIVLSDYGDNKYVVDFSDEWSMYKDEVYFEHLEEQNQTNILSQHEYSIGDDRFVFVFSEEDGKYSLNLMCYIDDKTDAFWTHISLNALFSGQEDLEEFIDYSNFSYSIMIGDGVVLMRNKYLLTLMSVDDGLISVSDYFSTEWMIENSRTSDYGEQVVNFLVDFIQNY